MSWPLGELNLERILISLFRTACYDKLGLTRLKHMTRNSSKSISSGVGQLTLVEHALCPLDSRVSLRDALVHETAHSYTDSSRKRRTARVRVFCPLGLLPQDELFIWGLLALTLADENSDGELHATRHYLLSQLGLIDAHTRRGGRQYRRFSEAIDRIAAVQYFNDGFYDPIRSEHCRINFGFFSYLLPDDPKSSRAWRIIWDPLFFKLAKATRGSLRFDLEVFRNLDVASRRLYLFASKLLARYDITHPIDVGELTTNVLGYDPGLRPFEQNARLRKCLRRLISSGILCPKETKLNSRKKSVVMAKGMLLRKHRIQQKVDSPFFQPLCDIGFRPQDAQRLIANYSTHLVREWIDITLAAKERFGVSFFNRSPAAFLRYYLQRAAAGKDGPPDWWLEIRKTEEQACANRARKRRPTRRSDQLPQKAMDVIDKVHDDIFHQFLAAGQSEKVAAENARKFHATASKRKR